MKIGTILLILTLICIIIFSIQNSTNIDINFLYWSSSTMSLALLTITCVILGILVGLSFYISSTIKSRKIKNSLKLEVKTLKTQIEALNALIYNYKNQIQEESIDHSEEEPQKSFFDA
ncbi:MAG: lipopolysaccharide assembly protein LapA domain-containing protein [Bacteroidales bacterium]